MGATRNVFPLRLRDERLRLLLREVAEREHISQNELIEQAIRHELALRATRLADELASAARRLSELSGPTYDEIITRSIGDFVSGEAEPEPLQAHALHGPAGRERDAQAGSDPLGVLAAFEAGVR